MDKHSNALFGITILEKNNIQNTLVIKSLIHNLPKQQLNIAGKLPLGKLQVFFLWHGY
jgi:hypothetical protein